MTEEYIAVLYVGKPPDHPGDVPFGRADGFTVHYWNETGGPVPVDFSPDIVWVGCPGGELLSTAHDLIRQLETASFSCKPAFFLETGSPPDWETLGLLQGYGYDGIFTFPVTPGEIRSRAKGFLERKALIQERNALKKRLEKAFSYLDTFKRELAGVKQELIHEKTSLNNALKQIHHMTRERGNAKARIRALHQDLADNLAGFEALLTDLIRCRVEINQGHHERVAAVARFVGEQLNIGEKKLEDLSKAAMLHEVGLLFMPDTGVRTSPDQMTIFEKDILMQYPVKGADLLSRCRGFESVAGIVRHMNENSDGTGFPDGLKKRYIPLPSRILAGADLLDTLRDAPDVNGLKDLLSALEAASGSRLDPLVVNCLQKYAVRHLGSEAYRVRGVGVENLEPGMRLGCALFTATGTKLFSADTLLTREAIDKIIQYNREYPVDQTVYVRA